MVGTYYGVKFAPDNLQPITQASAQAKLPLGMITLGGKTFHSSWFGAFDTTVDTGTYSNFGNTRYGFKWGIWPSAAAGRYDATLWNGTGFETVSVLNDSRSDGWTNLVTVPYYGAAITDVVKTLKSENWKTFSITDNASFLDSTTIPDASELLLPGAFDTFYGDDVRQQAVLSYITGTRRADLNKFALYGNSTFEMTQLAADITAAVGAGPAVVCLNCDGSGSVGHSEAGFIMDTLITELNAVCSASVDLKVVLFSDYGAVIPRFSEDGDVPALLMPGVVPLDGGAAGTVHAWLNANNSGNGDDTPESQFEGAWSLMKHSGSNASYAKRIMVTLTDAFGAVGWPFSAVSNMYVNVNPDGNPPDWRAWFNDPAGGIMKVNIGDELNPNWVDPLENPGVWKINTAPFENAPNWLDIS